MSRLIKISRLLCSKSSILSQTRLSSGSAVSKESLFFDSEVQGLMKKLTGLNYDKVFRRKKLGKHSERPIYQFMTQEELEEAQAEIRAKAEVKLQMPPVMEEREGSEARCQVLEEDSQLAGFDTCNYVFTDITFGVPDRSRVVVVRQPGGQLRTASWEEQDRLNLIYFPTEGRKHYIPQMFEPHHLKPILGPEKYEYILDRNCLQFEPDHPVYIRTCELVYQHISEHKHFDTLYSTRHYGPMVFSFCWNKNLDDFISHLIWTDNLEEAVAAVHLYLKIHSDCKMSSEMDQNSSDVNIIRTFAKFESLKAGKVNAALDKLLENKEAENRILSGHGAK